MPVEIITNHNLAVKHTSERKLWIYKPRSAAHFSPIYHFVQNTAISTKQSLRKSSYLKQ